MTNQELIESGLLELYVAGTLSEEDNIFITEKIAADLDLLEEVIAIEQAFCQYLASDLPTLSEDMKANILQDIAQMEQVLPTSPIAVNRTVASPSNATRQASIPIYSDAIPRQSTIRVLAPYLAVAAVLILSMSIVLNTFFFGELKSINQKMALLDAEDNTISKVTQVALSSSRVAFSEIPIQNIQAIEIELIRDAPSMSAKIFLDQVKQNLYLDANSLQTPPKNKTWQIWAQVAPNESFHSLGVLTLEEGEDNFFQLPSTNNIPIQYIHLSLEPKGGSMLPTQTEIYLSAKFF